MDYKIGGAINIERDVKEVRIAKTDVDNMRNEIKTIKEETISVRNAIKEIAKATAEMAILSFAHEDYFSLSSTEKTAKKDEIRESLLSALKILDAHNVDLSQVENIYHISGDK